MSVFWRIPMAIWQFVYGIFIQPIFSLVHRVLSLFGFKTDQLATVFPAMTPTPATIFTTLNEWTTPMVPVNPTW